MLIMIVYLVCIFVVVAVSVLAGLSDIRSLTIPNSYSLYAVIAFAVCYGVLYFSGNAGEVFGDISSHLMSGFITFLVTFVLFALGLLGAGDSKFGSACALWISLKYLPIYLFCMTLFGGVLGIVTLYIRHKKPFKSPAKGGWIEKAQSGADRVPYGVAIAFGLVVAFIHAEYLSLEVLSSF